MGESELIIHSIVNISNNKAQMFGGGIYAFLSVVEFKLDQKHGYPIVTEGLITNNFAGQNGGGMFVAASTIKFTHFCVAVCSNTALSNGGGLYLQGNSKIYLLKKTFDRRHRMQIKEITETSIQRFKTFTRRQDKTELVTDQGGTLETHYTAMKTHPRREQDLDVLAPITPDDYRPAPPPSDSHPKVTYTIVETTA